MTEKNTIPVILCGGSGTRLWPASRSLYPKQFLNLLGMGDSLLQSTVERAHRVTEAPYDNIVIVTGEGLAKEVEEQLSMLSPKATQHILGEPSARNTAAAIAFAASYIKDHFGAEAVMWVMPADHHMGDEAALKASYEDALQAVEDGYLVTMGINPDRPETGYGYIQAGKALMNERVLYLEEFKEKPDRESAAEYIKKGYLWNSGMFLFRADTVLSAFETHSPEIISGVEEARAKVKDENTKSVDPAAYASIMSVPFDIAIMEKASRGAVVPCDPEWSDIGSWESLWALRSKDENGNVLEGKVVCHDTKNLLVQSKDRVIACAGLENLVIVDTGDALLIADYSKGEHVKVLVDKMKETFPDQVTFPVKESKE